MSCISSSDSICYFETKGLILITHAELLKKLRKEKGFSQKQLSQGICARSTLSSFELQGSYISSDLLFAFLDRLNIRPDEYLYLLNHGESAKDHFFTEMEQAILKDDLAALKTIALTLRQKYQDEHDIHWLLLAFKCEEAVDKSLEVFSVPEFSKKHARDISMMKNYLAKANFWGVFEMALIGNILQYFPVDFIENVTRVFSEKLDLNFSRHKDLYVRTLINIGFFYLENQLYSQVFSATKLLTDVLTQEDIHWAMLKKLLEDLSRHKLTGETFNGDFLSIYTTLGFSDYEQVLHKLAERIINQN